MIHIKSQPISVNAFIEKLKTRTTNFTTNRQSSKNEVQISFSSPFRWGDGSEQISSLTLLYDPATENIKKITIIGSNLVQIVGYTYMNECYLWFTVKDMSQFDFEHVDDVPGVLVLNV